MQRWKAVARRYADFSPEPVRFPTPSDLNQRQVWLEDDVVPLLGELTRRLRFRELATFSLMALRRGSPSDARRLVERVDHALTDAASVLIQLTEHPEVEAGLRSRSALLRHEAGAEVTETEADGRLTATVARPTMAPASGMVSDLDLKISAVRQVARRDWEDLVEPDDYFSTRQEFVEGADGTRLQRAELINSVNPRLLPVGDLIVRGLRRRIDVRRGVLRDLHRDLHPILRDLPEMGGPERVRWHQAHTKLDEAVRQLEAHVFADAEAVLRDSCVALTQVFVAVHPAPEVDWLGLREDLLVEARGLLPALLRGHRGNVIADRIARAVEDIGQLYRGWDSSRSDLDEAIASGGLVIHLPDQSAWWEGEPINLGNSKKPKELLTLLARKAYRGLPVVEADLYPDEPASTSAMATVWGRLGQCLPSSLAQRIQPGPVPRSYQLHLDNDRIFLISAR